ncbi:MAG: transposase [Bdellovibrionales bacterium]|nr:transposase [Bdellovibrionales bacterium]
MREPKTYSQDFKNKVVKEYQETGSLTAVARSHSIPVTTLRQWVTKHMPKTICRRLSFVTSLVGGLNESFEISLPKKQLFPERAKREQFATPNLIV